MIGNETSEAARGGGTAQVAPKRRRGGYPWATIAVGESFLMPGIGIQGACRQYHDAELKHGRRFTAKSVGPGTKFPDDPAGSRVWRIA